MNVDKLDEHITLEECRKAIYKSKNKKAVGIECLSNKTLKKQSSIIVLYKLFNECLANHELPSLWSKSVPSTDRGISLISTICKLSTHILNNRLVNYLETNSLIDDEQNSFRKDRSCEDHTFTLTSILRNRKNANLDTFTYFVDMKKAFDRVNRDILYETF